MSNTIHSKDRVSAPDRTSAPDQTPAPIPLSVPDWVIKKILWDATQTNQVHAEQVGPALYAFAFGPYRFTIEFVGDALAHAMLTGRYRGAVSVRREYVVRYDTMTLIAVDGGRRCTYCGGYLPAGAPSTRRFCGKACKERYHMIVEAKRWAERRKEQRKS